LKVIELGLDARIGADHVAVAAVEDLALEETIGSTKPLTAMSVLERVHSSTLIIGAGRANGWDWSLFTCPSAVRLMRCPRPKRPALLLWYDRLSDEIFPPSTQRLLAALRVFSHASWRISAADTKTGKSC